MRSSLYAEQVIKLQFKLNFAIFCKFYNLSVKYFKELCFLFSVLNGVLTELVQNESETESRICCFDIWVGYLMTLPFIYLTLENKSDSDKLQRDLDGLQTWEARWDMEFNPSKCQVVRVTQWSATRVCPRSSTIFDLYK